MTLAIHDIIVFSKEIDFTVNALYTVFILSAILLNGAVIFVLLKRSIIHQKQQQLHQQGSFKIHMVNACVAHIMQVLGIIPFVVVNQRTIRFGNRVEKTVICGLVEGIVLFLVPAIVHCLVFISLAFNRYRAIRYPLDRFINSNRSSRWRLTLCWTIGVVLGLPNVLSWRYGVEVGRCIQIHTTGVLVYKIILFLVGLFIPLVIGIIITTITIILGFSSTSTRITSIRNNSNDNKSSSDTKTTNTSHNNNNNNDNNNDNSINSITKTGGIVNNNDNRNTLRRSNRNNSMSKNIYHQNENNTRIFSSIQNKNTLEQRRSPDADSISTARTNKIISTTSLNDIVSLVKDKYRTRITRLMVILMSMHVACWAPIGFYYFLRILGIFPNDIEMRIRVVRLTLFPCVLECTIAPVVYFFIKKDSRREFLNTLTFCCYRKVGSRFDRNRISPANN